MGDGVELFDVAIPQAYWSVRCGVRACHRFYDGRTWGVAKCGCGLPVVLCPECLNLLRQGDDSTALDHDTPESTREN